MYQSTESRISYPISSNVLIDYIQNESGQIIYPVFYGKECICFSLEPYNGNKAAHPSKVDVLLNCKLSRDEVESILSRLKLNIDDFEDWYVSNL